ncbi:hypothetical protein [Lentzea sp. NPDC059081]|uniref:hypothetical protein n=1 Tax=Lentzea sp. NPDC059081 TaxID=3346719 RepID=UPI00369F8062
MTRKLLTSEARKAQARYAARTRELGPDHPDTLTAQGEWRSERYLAAVAASVAAAPPLSLEQRDRLSQILRPAVIAADGSEVAA